MSSGKPRILPWEAVIGALMDLLFPPRCVVCGRVDIWLCPQCVGRLPRVSGAICLRCGVPVTRGNLCRHCRETPLRLEGIRSVLLFEGPVRAAIHRLKYRHARGLAEPLGGLLAERWLADPLPADLVVPVPLHPARLLQRGYNQAALLAHAFGRQVGLPVDEDALRRIRHTASQMRLEAAQRQHNVRGAFSCPDGRVEGRRILLVDDVCTTGATLEACADALHESGATSVWGLTLARAP